MLIAFLECKSADIRTGSIIGQFVYSKSSRVFSRSGSIVKMVFSNLNGNLIILFPQHMQTVIDRGFGVYIVDVRKKVNAL